jgi:ubiquitin-conjugating enzyme E2 variant
MGQHRCHAVLAVWWVARLATGAAAAPRLTLAAFILAYLSADLICGLVHWSADTWGSRDLPLLGRAFLRPFREHHVDPMSITRHDFVETNGNSCLVSLPVLGLALWLAPGVDGGGTVFPSAFLGALVCWVMLTNQFHKWAHLPDPGRVVALLQRLHLILPPANHAHHHALPFNTHYCITSGWLNMPLARARFFPLLERCVTWCTGALPRRDLLEAHAAAAGGAGTLPLPLPRPAASPGALPAGVDIPTIGAPG